MQGFERLGQFHRALRASHAAGAATFPINYPYTQQLEFAEGMLWALALVTPFWILVGYSISVISR